MKKEEDYFCDKCGEPLEYDSFYIRWVCDKCVRHDSCMRKWKLFRINYLCF